jgi:hypothetical protein
MLDHLIDFEPEVLPAPTEFVPLEKVGTADAIDAKVKTSEWLKGLGAVDDEDIADELGADAARKAFTSVVAGVAPETTHTALAQVKTPAAVAHLVGMLTAYDWAFVEQAKELRGYAVAKLLEETNNPSANIRLKALGYLGKVTEVGLFTDKIEVKKTEMSDAEIEQRIKDKLNRFAQIVEITDVTDIREIEELNAPAADDEIINTSGD